MRSNFLVTNMEKSFFSALNSDVSLLARKTFFVNNEIRERFTLGIKGALLLKESNLFISLYYTVYQR